MSTLPVSLETLLGFTLFGGVTPELLVATAIFAGRLPKRSMFALRAVLTCALFALVTGTLVLTGGSSFWVQVPKFAVTLAFLICGILVCFRTTISGAAFCATVGYVAQNIASGISNWLGDVATAAGTSIPSDVQRLVLLVCCVVVYALAYLLLARRIDSVALARSEGRGMFVMALLVVCVNIASDAVIKGLPDFGVDIARMSTLYLTHVIVSIFALAMEYELLVNNGLRVEVATMERMRLERERSYRLSRDTIDAINVKCHDIRHQIRQLGEQGAVVDGRVLDSIEHEVDVYDSHVETGNEVLDAALSEKGLVCSAEKIRLACIVDGSAVDFMETADIYSFFGNALENAINACRKVGDRGARSISVMVRKGAGMAIVHIENSCPEPVEFEDGLPRTAGDPLQHGFGTRSMRATVERYGGVLTMSQADGVFTVDAVIPLG